MSRTTACTFIPNFTPNEQMMKNFLTKIHLSKGKKTKNKTSVSFNYSNIIR